MICVPRGGADGAATGVRHELLLKALHNASRPVQDSRPVRGTAEGKCSAPPRANYGQQHVRVRCRPLLLTLCAMGWRQKGLLDFDCLHALMGL